MSSQLSEVIGAEEILELEAGEVRVRPVDLTRTYPARLTREEISELSRVMARNALAISRPASSETVSAGVGWYRLARREARMIAREAEISPRAAAGIISALSPRTSWALNLERARALAISGEPVGIREFSSRAQRIRGGERPLSVLSGPKTRAFYRNISGDLERVTIDIWALRALSGRLEISSREYHMLERIGAYELAEFSMRAGSEIYSRELGVRVRPAEFQAIAWLSVRPADRREESSTSS